MSALNDIPTLTAVNNCGYDNQVVIEVGEILLKKPVIKTKIPDVQVKFHLVNGKKAYRKFNSINEDDAFICSHEYPNWLSQKLRIGSFKDYIEGKIKNYIIEKKPGIVHDNRRSKLIIRCTFTEWK